VLCTEFLRLGRQGLRRSKSSPIKLSNECHFSWVENGHEWTVGESDHLINQMQCSNLEIFVNTVNTRVFPDQKNA
jgi:hypothetical protein